MIIFDFSVKILLNTCFMCKCFSDKLFYFFFVLLWFAFNTDAWSCRSYYDVSDLQYEHMRGPFDQHDAWSLQKKILCFSHSPVALSNIEKKLSISRLVRKIYQHDFLP